MKIPSRTSHNNWKTGLTITVNGVDFKMLPVAGNSGGFFLLSETETTIQQYEAVTSTNIGNSKRPATKSISDFNTFITKLNNLTSLSFYIPTSQEWYYAASGGNLSQGYTYAGSNTPGDVAWYAANSGDSTHEVKQLAPNELGFYDMSGNVYELTINPDNNGYHYRGGDYSSSDNQITTTRYSTSGGSLVYGLRLALKCE